jgi:hypothetical protein
MKLEPGDKIEWGLDRSGTVQAIENDELVILDDGWPASLWGDGSVRSVTTPPFVFRHSQLGLHGLRKKP